MSPASTPRIPNTPSPGAEAPPTVGAILLAGGRGARLGGIDKPLLTIGGRSLLRRAIDAVQPIGAPAAIGTVATARPITVVGPDRPAASLSGAIPASAGDAVQRLREDPPHGGPAAAVITALDAWGRSSAALPEWTLVLACDLVDPASAVARLKDALAALIATRAETDGIHLTDDAGRAQWLTACYRTAALVRAADAVPARGQGASMRALVAPLHLVALPPAGGASGTIDIDTWDDLHRSGARLPDTASLTPTAPPKETP